MLIFRAAARLRRMLPDFACGVRGADYPPDLQDVLEYAIAYIAHLARLVELHDSRVPNFAALLLDFHGSVEFACPICGASRVIHLPD